MPKTESTCPPGFWEGPFSHPVDLRAGAEVGGRFCLPLFPLHVHFRPDSRCQAMRRGWRPGLGSDHKALARRQPWPLLEVLVEGFFHCRRVVREVAPLPLAVLREATEVFVLHLLLRCPHGPGSAHPISVTVVLLIVFLDVTGRVVVVVVLLAVRHIVRVLGALLIMGVVLLGLLVVLDRVVVGGELLIGVGVVPVGGAVRSVLSILVQWFLLAVFGRRSRCGWNDTRAPERSVGNSFVEQLQAVGQQGIWAKHLFFAFCSAGLRRSLYRRGIVRLIPIMCSFLEGGCHVWYVPKFRRVRAPVASALAGCSSSLCFCKAAMSKLVSSSRSPLDHAWMTPSSMRSNSETGHPSNLPVELGHVLCLCASISASFMHTASRNGLSTLSWRTPRVCSIRVHPHGVLTLTWLPSIRSAQQEYSWCMWAAQHAEHLIPLQSVECFCNIHPEPVGAVAPLGFELESSYPTEEVVRRLAAAKHNCAWDCGDVLPCPCKQEMAVKFCLCGAKTDRSEIPRMVRGGLLRQEAHQSDFPL